MSPDGRESSRVVTPALLREWALPEPGLDKRASGQLLVLGGSTRSPGAVRLAGEAALRAGTGKVTLATVEYAMAGLMPLVPEAGLVPLAADANGSIEMGSAGTVVEEVGDVDALLAGPGLVDTEHAVALLERVLPRTDALVVLDGLASAYVTRCPDGLRHLEGRVVLTVNPVELARTARTTVDEVTRDPLRVAAHVARRSRVVVLCGGTVKHLVTPDGEAWVVEGGGPGLATSGSGDVLAGILAGLLARGAAPAQAAAWAGYVHARCGERLAAAVGPVGYLARELPAEVPRVLAELG